MKVVSGVNNDLDTFVIVFEFTRKEVAKLALTDLRHTFNSLMAGEGFATVADQAAALTAIIEAIEE